MSEAPLICMYFGILMWVMGGMFTVGLTMDPEKKPPLSDILWVMVGWPLVFGGFVRAVLKTVAEYVDEKDKKKEELE